MKIATYKKYFLHILAAAISSQVLAASVESEPRWGSFFVSGVGEINAAPLTAKSALSSDTSDDEIKGNYRPRLYWSSQLRAGVHVKDCTAYLHNSNIGAINTNQETLNFWQSYDSGGFHPSDNTNYNLDLDAFSMKGNGVGAGCAKQVSDSLNLDAAINFANLDDARWRSIHGSAGASQGITYLNATDSKWNVSSPMLPQLQSVGSAKAYWLAFSAKWKSQSLPLQVDVDAPVFMGKIYANNAPFMDRNWNLSKSNGVIKSGDGSSPIGQYGNKNLTYSIPNLWSVRGVYSLSNRLQPTTYTQGVGNSFTQYFGNTWSAPINNLEKLELLVDTSIESLILTGSSKSWSIGVGVSLQRTSDLTKPLMLKFGFYY